MPFTLCIPPPEPQEEDLTPPPFPPGPSGPSGPSGPVNNSPAALNLARSLSVASGPVCSSAEQFSWTFSDIEDGAAQNAYQLQADNNANFASPEFDSDVVSSGATSRSVTVSVSPGLNQFTFATTYFWRVRVRDSAGVWSNYANGSSFNTPLHPYPAPDFNFNPQAPKENQTVTFVDTTQFFGSSISWSWSLQNAQFVDGSTSTSQNPHAKFLSTGAKSATLTVTDPQLAADPFSGSGQCSAPETVSVSTQLETPEIREVPPTQ